MTPNLSPPRPRPPSNAGMIEGAGEDEPLDVDALGEMVATCCPLLGELPERDVQAQVRLLLDDTWDEALAPERPAGEGARGGPAGGATDGEGEEAFLRGLCGPTVPLSYLRHVVSEVCGGSVAEAADYIVEAGAGLAGRARAWEEAEAAARRESEAEAEAVAREKRKLVDKFLYQSARGPAATVLPGNKGPLLSRKERARQPEVRYRDGKAVACRAGEKYITEKVGEEWDGGSRGKVITKGKRGVGYR